jgi:hypothetical protein
VSGTGVPEHLIRRYLRGGCYALAHEAARISGLPLMGLRDASGAVHHAFVADPDTGSAWDVRGRMPVASVGDGSAVIDPRITPLEASELLDLLGDACPYALDAAARTVRTYLVPAGLPVRDELRIRVTPNAAAPGPDAGTREPYLRRGCHLFAIAALDLLSTGAVPLGFRVVTDPEEPFWESETDPDDQVPAVVHVYAVLRGPEGEVAVDVLGARPLTAAVDECGERFGVRRPGFEDYSDLEGLRDLIEEEGDQETAERRPLWPISGTEVAAARDVAARLFRDGIPVPEPEAASGARPETSPDGP